MYEEKEIKYKKRKKEKIPKEKTETKRKKQPKNEEKNESKKNNKTKKEVVKKETKKTNKKKKNNSALLLLIKKINWKLLAIKLILLFISMMLVIFTISRIKKHHEKQNETFNNNISIISEASLEYFSQNPLPKNIGDSTSFILEEMKNLNLISEIKNEDNKFCNYLDSYIILTKTTNEEYRLKIYLKCPDKNKTIEEKMVCTENSCFIKK